MNRKITIIRNLQDLRESLTGNKNCTILISKRCSREIDKISYSNYEALKKELKLRNINLEVSN